MWSSGEKEAGPVSSQGGGRPTSRLVSNLYQDERDTGSRGMELHLEREVKKRIST